jgi:acyl-CoA synthetase (AMP-forming)/AMP-acid ligase II
MTPIDDLLGRFDDAPGRPAIVWRDQTTTYGELRAHVEQSGRQLQALGCAGAVVCLAADFSPAAIGLLIALWRSNNTVALMTNRNAEQGQELAALTQAQWLVECDGDGPARWQRRPATATHPLLRQLTQEGEPGLVIFSSGTTGQPKASVHRVLPLLRRHTRPKRCLTSIAFLLFDHIGGLNALCYVLFNGGKLVIPASRQPFDVARAIAAHRVQALTTSPTFINLLLLSGAARQHDLRSLEVINYSSEPMPDSALQALHRLLPDTRLSQSYGLTETGVIPARSESSRSTRLALGDAGCQVRIVDGMLEIKSNTTMLGYINAASPFTDDGYFKTGDMAVRDGEFYRILGRRSDLINVGGQKVFPSEIENVLRTLPNVADVVVGHEKHAIAGNLIKATFTLSSPEPLDQFKARLYQRCGELLEPFQIPRKVLLATAPLHTERFKKDRKLA